MCVCLVFVLVREIGEEEKSEMRGRKKDTGNTKEGKERETKAVGRREKERERVKEKRKK